MATGTRALGMELATARGEVDSAPDAISGVARCQRRRAQTAPMRCSQSQGAQSASNTRLIEPLTQRELEILTLVCDGASNSEISKRVGVALPTVKFHVYQIFGKLGVLRRTQAVAVAIHLQLVRPAWLQPS